MWLYIFINLELSPFIIYNIRNKKKMLKNVWINDKGLYIDFDVVSEVAVDVWLYT